MTAAPPSFAFGKASLYRDDCLTWLARQPPNSIHAVCTDPPYGDAEYSPAQLDKLAAGTGGVWRQPPTLGGHRRAPLPRFTTVDTAGQEAMREFFADLGTALYPVLVPGAHVLVAANPLLAHIVTAGLESSGLEMRGTLVRLVQTLRGGDRPKGAHVEFTDVTVMPRSKWEPWILLRKPCEGTVAQNLRRWGTGGLRRESAERPFGDVIASERTPARERALAPHPSLKPQRFLRPVVTALLPLGTGVILDPFAGSGSTLAAAEAVGYASVGVERHAPFAELAVTAIPALAALYPPG